MRKLVLLLGMVIISSVVAMDQKIMHTKKKQVSFVDPLPLHNEIELFKKCAQLFEKKSSFLLAIDCNAYIIDRLSKLHQFELSCAKNVKVVPALQEKYNNRKAAYYKKIKSLYGEIQKLDLCYSELWKHILYAASVFCWTTAGKPIEKLGQEVGDNFWKKSNIDTFIKIELKRHMKVLFGPNVRCRNFSYKDRSIDIEFLTKDGTSYKKPFIMPVKADD